MYIVNLHLYADEFISVNNVYVYKCLHDLAPSYLNALINTRTVGEGLRTSSQDVGTILDFLKIRRKTFQDRFFSVAAPAVWNQLPVSIRNAQSLGIFKKTLKTHFFTTVFSQ